MSTKKHPLSSVTEYESGRFQDVFWLQACITDAFLGGGYQKLREYLQHRESYVPQSHDHLLLHQLDKTMNKELHGREFQCVSLLLKCLQRFFVDGLTEEEPLLILQGVIPKMVSWFEETVRLLTKEDLTSDASLITATKDFLETALIISRNSYKGRIQMLDAFVFSLGFLVTEKLLNHSIGQEALRTLNCILETVPWAERKKLHLLEGPCLFMKDLARTILTDCRQFLNCLNSRLGDRRRVYTFPCISAFADDHEMRKPDSEKLEEFWIDFNLGSQSITFYIDNPKSALWEPVKILKEAVGNFCTIEMETMKMLVIHLKQPMVIGNKDVMKTKIHFDLQFGISHVSRKVLGGDDQTVPYVKEESSESIGPLLLSEPSTSEQSGAEESAPTVLLEQSAAEESGPTIANQEPLMTNLKHKLPTLEDTDLSDGGFVTPKQSRWEDGVSREFHSSVREENDMAVTSESDFSTELEETSVQVPVPGGKGISSSYSALKGQRKQDTEMSTFMYNKHLFSETSEDSSNTSERSWTRGSQPRKKPLKVYSNKKKKVAHRRMKILPLSPISSDSDLEKGQPKLVRKPPPQEVQVQLAADGKA
ncbi:synaptonemal complex protein 2-like [Echinops telfairi]|uniref:Synaptonemal complex protein 2-like n=1 Tax=Echinops telfairi TaxID=9371 RepID=A0AC55DQY5_ECHTE|nr:synaptonemal complex protein 2-like [Echinops telfairi]